MSDSERERIRQEKLEKLKEQAKQSHQKQDQQKKNQAIDSVFKQATTSDARQRLNTVKMTKPELAGEVKRQIVSAFQSDRISAVIDDEKMKDLLSEAHNQTSKDFDIQRR